MLTKRDQIVIESIINDTRRYATSYSCSLEEAFQDVIADEPTERLHAEAACLILGLSVAPEWIAANTVTREEVNQYQLEVYGD